jgi:hypothetical protein
VGANLQFRQAARFEIGLPLPADKQSSEIAGYHRWSDLYAGGKGWIPVDISEAWKHQEKRDYFFGSHDVNRIQLEPRTQIAPESSAGRQAAEIFCLSLWASRWAGVSQRLNALFVCGSSYGGRGEKIGGH